MLISAQQSHLGHEEKFFPNRLLLYLLRHTDHGCLLADRRKMVLKSSSLELPTLKLQNHLSDFSLYPQNEDTLDAEGCLRLQRERSVNFPNEIFLMLIWGGGRGEVQI